MSGFIYNKVDCNKESLQEDSDRLYHSGRSSQSWRPMRDSAIGATLNPSRFEHFRTWYLLRVRPKIAKPPHRHYLENLRHWTRWRLEMPFHRQTQANRHEDEKGARDVQAELHSETRG